MRANRVTTLARGFELINIDSGEKKTLGVGETHELEHAEGRRPLDYYVLRGTRDGAIRRHWEDKQREGVIRLHVVAEAGDPTVDGIVLPITSGSQLTEWQKDHLVCGHLVKGHFLCERCTLNHSLVYPDAVAVYPRNILPYSQVCSECGLVVINIWQSRKGGPLSLFD